MGHRSRNAAFFGSERGRRARVRLFAGRIQEDDHSGFRPEEDPGKLLGYLTQNKGDGLYRGHWKHRKKDGKIIEVETTVHELEYSGERVRLIVAQNVSERHILEQQLRQSQKME